MITLPLILRAGCSKIDVLIRFNQTTIAYDASKEEKLDALRAKKAMVEERLREKSA